MCFLVSKNLTNLSAGAGSGSGCRLCFWVAWYLRASRQSQKLLFITSDARESTKGKSYFLVFSPISRTYILKDVLNSPCLEPERQNERNARLDPRDKQQLAPPRGAYRVQGVHGGTSSSQRAPVVPDGNFNACHGLSTCSTAGIRPKVGETAGGGGPPRPRSRPLCSRAGSVCVCVSRTGDES